MTTISKETKKAVAYDYYHTALTINEIADKHQISSGNIHHIKEKYKPTKEKKNETGILLINPKDLEVAANILKEYSIDFEMPKKAEVNIFLESKLNFS